MSGMSADKRKIAGLFALGLVLSIGPISSLLSSDSPIQDAAGQIEPFYLRLYKSGESAFLAGKYLEAAQNLNVAVFGLYPDRQLLARAQIFLGLSRVKSGDEDGGRQAIDKALAALGGPDRLETLELPGGAATDLAGLLKKWKIPGAAPPAKSAGVPPPTRTTESSPSTPVPSKPRNPADTAVAPSRIGELKAAIDLDSRNVGAYVEMADLLLQAGNAAAAKDTLKTMLKENPAEIDGYMSLGRISYAEKNYKETEAHLGKFLDLARAINSGRDRVVEARALRLLALHHRGETRKLRKFVLEYRAELDEAAIEALVLSSEDKGLLRSLLLSEK